MAKAKMNIKKSVKKVKSSVKVSKVKSVLANDALSNVANVPANIEVNETGIAKKVKPLADRILIKEITAITTETTTKSGIIIPVTVSEDKSSKSGEVVAVGMGRYENGILINSQVKIGDKVLFGWGDKIKVDGEEYYLVREAEIMAVIK